MNKYTSVILLLVFLFFSNSLFSAPGDLIWKTKISDYYSPTSPVVASDLSEKLVFVMNERYNNKILALNALDGSIKWVQNQGYIYETIPFYSNGLLYIGSGWLFCLNAENGKPKWSYKDEESQGSFMSPIVVNNIVYAENWSRFYAINAENGSRIWRSDWTDDEVPFRSCYLNGILVTPLSYGINASNGEILWDYRGGGYSTQPITLGNNVYFGGPLVLDYRTGKLVWEKKGEYDLTSSACISKGVVYYASEYSSYLYALNAYNGDLIWASLLGTISYSSPCVANETVYIGSEFGYLHAINANDGVRRWIFKADAEIRTTPCIEDSIIYFGCEDGFLYAVNIGEKKGFEDRGYSRNLPSPSLSPYPNPFRDRLTIEVSDKARVYSLTGQLIMNLPKGKHSIDTSKWRQGVYIVKSGTETKRIVKIN